MCLKKIEKILPFRSATVFTWPILKAHKWNQIPKYTDMKSLKVYCRKRDKIFEKKSFNLKKEIDKHRVNFKIIQIFIQICHDSRVRMK